MTEMRVGIEVIVLARHLLYFVRGRNYGRRDRHGLVLVFQPFSLLGFGSLIEGSQLLLEYWVSMRYYSLLAQLRLRSFCSTAHENNIVRTCGNMEFCADQSIHSSGLIITTQELATAREH